MANEKQIREWLESGTISSEQAEKMLVDVNRQSKEDKTSKFVVAISTIGAIILGIGMLLFVASNWKAMPDLIKIFILFVSTFGSYYLGYVLKYSKKNLPRIGASLIFLGALLFGVSIFLIAQIYNINANAHSLVLIWLVGIVPLVYAFNSQPIAALASILFVIWALLFSFEDKGPFLSLFIFLPIVFFSIGVFILSVGGLHYFKPQLAKIGKIFRMAGVGISMVSLFILTFNFFWENFFSETAFRWLAHREAVSTLVNPAMINAMIFFGLSIFGLLLNLIFNPSKSKMNIYENMIPISVIFCTLLAISIPSSIYILIFNLSFAVITLFLIYAGYQKANIKLINIGTFWLSVFLFTKYFELFWRLMDRSLFFIIGGVLLLSGGIFMERKMKQIKRSIRQINTPSHE